MSDCLITKDELAFLEKITSDVIEESRIKPGQVVDPYGPNITGGTIIRPGGRDCYPAFWVRDYAMSLATGFITAEEQRHALLLTARHQQDGDWATPSGSFVPNGSIVDHVSLSDKPIYFPGTIDDYENQGGIFGKYPALDDHFYFIHMAHYYIKSTGDVSILQRNINEKQLMDRLELAFVVPPSRTNHMVYCQDQNRGVTFGFVDSVVHTGELFFCSLLKFRAARQLAKMFKSLGQDEKFEKYSIIAETIKSEIPKTFEMVDGLFLASTGKSCQPDVWGSAFGVYIGAFEPETESLICRALCDGYKDHTLSYKGNIRHVRTTDDCNDATAWEETVDNSPKNTYQNGPYWGTPTGWVCYAIKKISPKDAGSLAREYIDELREGDFRKGPDFCSPWECFHPEGNYRRNPVYMTSVTCPLIPIRANNA